MATRKASKWCLDALATHYPQLFGGSADLTPSNLTKWDTALPYNAQQYQGNYLHYGVREFAQFAIVNGINTYQGFHAFAATFLTFVDYGKNALRLAAMMKIPSIFIFTHDSIGLGEDGPTHQPIEHLAHLRAIPNMNVWRPSDLQETLAAWQDALNQTTQPTCITLSRQTCPQQIQKGWGKPSNGAYVLSGIKNQPAQLILLATGSEVQLITQAAEILREIYPTANILTVSMPSINRFLKQNQTYQTQILPPNIPKIIVEAAHPQSWYNIKRDQDYFVGVDAFGYSAPGEAVFQKMGVTVDVIIHHAKGIL